MQAIQKTGLYWLGNDLRRHDNECFVKASESVEHLLIVYCIEPQWLTAGRYQQMRMGQHRRQFLAQSLKQLKHQLESEGQQLLIFAGDPLTVLPKLIAQYNVQQVFRSLHPGFDEQQQWLSLRDTLEQSTPQQILKWHELDNLSLINQHDIMRACDIDVFNKPIAIDMLHNPSEHKANDFIPSFSKFRRIIETAIKKQHLIIDPPLTFSRALPKPAALSPTNYTQLAEHWVSNIDSALELDNTDNASDITSNTLINDDAFLGGERAAQEHLKNYFSDLRAHQYKSVRNSLGGWENSTKFSAWLANGSLSARQVIAALVEFEEEHERSDSSYWIFFELLWREYFFWYALFYQKDLFRFSGIQQRRPLCSFYPDRFKGWTDASTPYPLVNACMTQLNQTGYMSNRGRQIVASCFVNELELDWRYGAAYFETQLIDYDVGANWGNWQYLAGVGADPRSNDNGGRHFDLVKQQQRFDPKGEFIRQWLGNDAGLQHSESAIDHVDINGWPIA